MNTITQGKDRREHPRFRGGFPVKYQLLGEKNEPKGDVFQGYANDVAQEGMSIESMVRKQSKDFKLVPDKSKLRLMINIPPDDSFSLSSTATVKWSKKVSEPSYDAYFFGVRYEEVSDMQRRMIERYISWLHRKPRFAFYFFLLSLTLIALFAYIFVVLR